MAEAPAAGQRGSPSPLPHSRPFGRIRNLPKRFRSEPYTMEKRPTFAQWLKVTWPDFLTMLVLGAVAITVYQQGPPGTRYFPLLVRDTGEVVYPQFAYPYRQQYIPSWLDTVLAISFPVLFICLAQIRIRSFWDFNNALIGLTYALLVSSVFQVMIKWLVGGLRPNFYDVCQPRDMSILEAAQSGKYPQGAGYQNYMFTSDICSTKKVRHLWNAMQSFPSGHSTTITAAAVYLFLYFNAKLKVFSNYHPSMWKLVLLYSPILGAVLACGSLIVDNSHNWYDVTAGAIIGMVFAFSAYRMVYASVWDWRINHVPLNRLTGRTWAGEREREDLVFTRRDGWKQGESGEEKGTLPGHVSSQVHNTGQYDGNTDEVVVGPSNDNNITLKRMQTAVEGDEMV